MSLQFSQSPQSILSLVPQFCQGAGSKVVGWFVCVCVCVCYSVLECLFLIIFRLLITWLPGFNQLQRQVPLISHFPGTFRDRAAECQWNKSPAGLRNPLQGSASTLLVAPTIPIGDMLKVRSCRLTMLWTRDGRFLYQSLLKHSHKYQGNLLILIGET